MPILLEKIWWATSKSCTLSPPLARISNCSTCYHTFPLDTFHASCFCMILLQIFRSDMPWNVRKNPCWISFVGLNLTTTSYVFLRTSTSEAWREGKIKRISLHGLQTYCQWLWLGLYRRSLMRMSYGSCWYVTCHGMVCSYAAAAAAASEFNYYTGWQLQEFWRTHQ